MKKVVILLGLGMSLVMTGCLPSGINPFYSENDLVFDPNIIGSWGESDVETTFIERADSLVYKVSLEDESGRAAFEGHLFKINDMLFLDLYPDAEELTMNETYKEHLIPVHSLYRVEKTHPDLVLNVFDYDWLAREMDRQPAPLAHIKVQGRIFFTATTEELQAFVVKNMATAGAWSDDPLVLHRIIR